MAMPALPAKADTLLPHKGRMCCIDSLVSCGDTEATAEAVLGEGHVLLRADGVMDPCGFIELGAQTAGAMHAAVNSMAESPPALAMLAGIQKFTVRGKARAGDRLTVSVALLGELEGMSSLSFSVEREGEQLAQGRLKVFMPGPDFVLQGGE